MLAQRFRQTLHRVCQSFTGLSLYEHPSNSHSPPQLPATQPQRTRPSTRTRHLRLGTFNVQSIGSQRKQHETLPSDLKAYKLDIVGLQETRIPYQSEQKAGTYHLLTLPTSNHWHGIGFAIAPHLRRFLYKYWAQSDRIGVLQLRLPRAQRINIINVYSPHSGYPDTTLDQFYADLTEAHAKLPRRDTTFILGDFNAKVGRRRHDETFVGEWGRGRRNRNGTMLSTFCDSNRLFLTNTEFRKRARNITTWTHRLADRSIFNQIDYIICHQDQKSLCVNAQSWGGTLTQSDHKLVTLDFNIRRLSSLRRRQASLLTTVETRLATHQLVYKDDYRRQYRERLAASLNDIPHHRDATNQRWNTVLNKAMEAAADTVGYLPRVPQGKLADAELAHLSQEQRRLRLLIYNDHAQDAKALRRQRNAILHQIRERSKSIATAYIDEKLTTMEKSSPSARLFTATRALFQKRSPLTSLLDSEGKYILSRKAAGKKIKHHFQEQFIDPHRQPVPDDGLKQPLESPIEAEELERAFKRLRNGRAAGPDAIPAELLKYGASILAQPLADIINHGLTTGDNIHLGDGILLGLPKPNKPAGQCTSLRPIVLLNSIRKAISLVVLHRISPKVERFLSPHQSGFRPSRSTADAVWAHRWIAARALRYRERFHILGIDLSRAFDTVNRDKLLSVLEDIVNKDEMRLIRLLLRGTNLSLRLDNSTLLSPFESNTGTPQGDSLSPVLFVVYLEAALRNLASELGTDHDLLADMIVYADDADFVCRQPEIAALIEAQAPAILAKWSLQMNTTKTEHTEILRSPTACSTRISRKIHEAWRNTRKLGSLLGDTEDLSRRKNLASAAFHRLWKIWLRPLRTSEETRVRLYNCYILPILLYNSGAWALTQADLVGLESFHRQQLRQVIGVRYPDWISNDKLYDRTGTEPLRYVLLRNRWRLFGHILRRPTNIPAFRFMDAYFARGKQGSWRGRRRLTLPLVLDADLQTLSSGHRLRRAPDLYLLRTCAQDRKGWKRLIDGLLAHVPIDGLWSRAEGHSRT